MATGLPIMITGTNTWQTAVSLQNFNVDIPEDDRERIELVQDYVAGHIDKHWIESLTVIYTPYRRLIPPAFRYQQTEMARHANKRVVLPEGEEPRTIKAAAICAERGIARPVLLGNPEEIRRVAEQQGVVLTDRVEIIDPLEVRERYVPRLVELRKNKGMTEVVAREQLEDNVVLGTMMLERGEVDGLVSGAVHTTANTIRPPMQIIKTAPGSSLISSIFFMLLPDQVLVYGDCAINPDPSAEQLAEIAWMAAQEVQRFGLPPKVAFLSHSSYGSSKRASARKMARARDLFVAAHPEIECDGELHGDAALQPEIRSAYLGDDSTLRGSANLLICPNLDAANILYNVMKTTTSGGVTVGPILMGAAATAYILTPAATVRRVLNMTALAVASAAARPR